MNYIKELNAFYDWLETNSLSTSAIVLWHALMSINNKTGWITEFGVAVSVLCVKTGLAPRTVTDARNELKLKGRIDWRSRKGNQSALYKIIPFFSSSNTYKPTDNDTNNNLSALYADSSANNHADKYADSSADNHATLYKLNQTKLNNNSCSSYARASGELVDNSLPKFIEQEFDQMLNSTCIMQIQDWQTVFPDEMIRYAVERAVLAGVKDYRYVNSIINSWLRNNIKTLDEAKRADEEFSRKKKIKSLRRTEGKSQVVDSNKRDLSYLVE